ncbi:hypothetical protein C8C83_4944 [Flavobacterium sp. 90]|nr:hypothetical protein C8C83_4944 [Flavobacterium sp. 90]
MAISSSKFVNLKKSNSELNSIGFFMVEIWFSAKRATIYFQIR